ncbi:unnamed protein product [Phytophthora fragariaefolia]|uniref:Unnamed protein product n=1 Tax=Phytophthora fragariaefolia TaxID=1490495 RepID=A0A9W6WYI0_9STRA|nr:unnamed protein product [Phytophthora fragariaefolia]
MVASLRFMVALKRFGCFIICTVTSQFVGTLTAYHAFKSKGHMWFEDRKWLQHDWRWVSSDVSIFGNETSTDFISTDAVPDPHWVLVVEAISKFASSRMLTEFATVSGKGMRSPLRMLWAGFVGGG